MGWGVKAASAHRNVEGMNCATYNVAVAFAAAAAAASMGPLVPAPAPMAAAAAAAAVPAERKYTESASLPNCSMVEP